MRKLTETVISSTCTLTLLFSSQTPWPLLPSPVGPARRCLRLVASFHASVAQLGSTLLSWIFLHEGLGEFVCFTGKPYPFSSLFAHSFYQRSSLLMASCRQSMFWFNAAGGRTHDKAHNLEVLGYPSICTLTLQAARCLIITHFFPFTIFSDKIKPCV